MRAFRLLPVLVCFAVSSAAAQDDPFGDVTNDPRPAEFRHWDAAAFAELVSELEAERRDGPGIWGTPFYVGSALERADHRPHDIQIIHRGEYTQPEIHETKWDLYLILDGSATVRVGGERVDYDPTQAHADQRPQLRGAREFEVTKGDLLHVPARTWHQVAVEPGATVTYALINVFE